MNKQLKGFTILEALISLILTGIIIGLIYSLFTVISSQMHLFNKENTQILEYNLFNTALKRDIDQSVSYSISDDNLRLEYYNQDIINYTFSGKYIIRENLIKKDTFEVNLITFEIKNNVILNTKKERISLKLKVLKDTIQANYILSRSISEIINNTEFSEN